MGPVHWGLDGLVVPPGKASKLLTDHPIAGKPLKWFSQIINTYKPYCFAWWLYL